MHSPGRASGRAAPRQRIRVGVCGFPAAQKRVFAVVDIVEVQQTFYQPPLPATAARWRERAPPELVFTVKAWQLITHPASSPTYRRLRTPLGETERAQCGGFRLNALTRRAWACTLAVAAALDARAVVLQTPASFAPTAENLERMRRFLGSVERDGRRLVFEPRGPAWNDAVLRPLLAGLDLVHAVDPFVRRPLGRGLRYFRLHGRPAGHYHYRYSDAELQALAGMLPRQWPAWVLFNNDSMLEDAKRLRAMLGRAQTSSSPAG